MISPADSAEQTTAGERDAASGACELLLFVLRQDGRTAVYPLPQRGSVCIGRGRAVDLRIDASAISRRHALLHVSPRLAIEDLGSANGTRLQREPIPAHRATAIQVGDVIEMAGVLLSVQERRGLGSSAPQRGRLTFESDVMREVCAEADRVAAGAISVLITGETGVGKEFLAQRIHQFSRRTSRPFLRLNCAALSESLADSELFGHEKGAFSGALAAKRGLIEMAEGGTLFLDEVGELPLTTQAKLLRALEHGEFFRVGGVAMRRVDVRYVAATNRNLEAEVARRAFRQDLYFRLAGAILRVPPLRERRVEILPWARQFVQSAAEKLGLTAPELTPQAAAALEAHAWPGNLRELRNAMERAVLLSAGASIRAEHVRLVQTAPPCALPDGDAPPLEVRTEPPPPPASEERDRLIAVLAQFGGNQTYAARHLGISRHTLLTRIERYGIARPRRPS